MRVRILKAISSATWSYRKGQEVDLPPEMALTWIGSGLAEPVRSAEVEDAVSQAAPERAVSRDAHRHSWRKDGSCRCGAGYHRRGKA